MNTKLEKIKENAFLYHTIIQTANAYHVQGQYAKLDMHIHSNNSDGNFSVSQIIMMAKRIGLERMFFTDHNIILPTYEKVIKFPKSENLTVDVGCEIACKIEDYFTGKFFPIEILAYYADPYKLQEFLNDYNFSNNISQEEQLNMLISICDTIGLQHSVVIDLKNGEYATEVLCKDLRKYKKNEMFFMSREPQVWEEPKLFYKKFVANPKTDFYIDTTADLPYYKDVIDIIIKSGGIPIIAHPFLYIYKSESKVKKMLNYIFSDSAAKGIEAYHSAHNYKQRRFLFEYAKENSLLYSGGSDFHSGPETILGYGRKECPLFLDENKINWV